MTQEEFDKKKTEQAEKRKARKNNMLDMSRIESGSVKIEKTNVHLPDVLADLKTIILESVHAKQQKLLIKMQDVVHEDIITDKLRLK